MKSLKQLGKGAWKIAPAFQEQLKQAASKPRPSGSPPHDLLWETISNCFPTAVRELDDVVPGRRFRIDIALTEHKLAIEIDGWQWHGKYLKDFQRDRERQNLLTIQGWRILRFTAGDVYKDRDGCLQLVLQACRAHQPLG